MIGEEVYETFIEHQRVLPMNRTNGHMPYYIFFRTVVLTFIAIAVSFLGLTLFPQRLNFSQKKRYLILSTQMLIQVTILRTSSQFRELEIVMKIPGSHMPYTVRRLF
jgi:hypothetical protein